MNKYEKYLVRRYKKPAPITVSVNCAGKRHKIILSPDGALGFPNHSSVEELDLLHRIGKCRCYEIYHRWRSLQGYPRPFHRLFDVALSRHNQREKNRKKFAFLGIDAFRKIMARNLSRKIKSVLQRTFGDKAAIKVSVDFAPYYNSDLSPPNITLEKKDDLSLSLKVRLSFKVSLSLRQAYKMLVSRWPKDIMKEGDIILASNIRDLMGNKEIVYVIPHQIIKDLIECSGEKYFYNDGFPVIGIMDKSRGSLIVTESPDISRDAWSDMEGKFGEQVKNRGVWNEIFLKEQ